MLQNALRNRVKLAQNTVVNTVLENTVFEHSFSNAGALREQFILSAAQSKGGKTRAVYLNQCLRRALAEYGAGLNLSDPDRALFESQKAGQFSANTMCQPFLDIYKAVGSKDASSHSGRRTYITSLANIDGACVSWQNLHGTAIFRQHSGT